ncbi:MAG: pitrilysin family protein [Bacteroidota bacterium]|nr:pitrilysin family protein [Bacteroidota bacterium]
MESAQRIEPPLHSFITSTDIPLRQYHLSNGIPVFEIDAGTEEVTRIEFVFRAGSIKEDMPLLASSTNAMLTEGSQNYTSEELNRLLDYYGIFLNPNVEKDTGGLVVFFLNRHIGKVLGLIREVLFRPAFPGKELDLLMKKRHSWFLVNREKVQNLAMDSFFESVFGVHHPYGRQVLEKDFETMMPAILKDFHAKYYKPEDAAVIISGKIPKKTVSLMEEYFGKLHSAKIYIEESANVLKGGAVRKVYIEKPGAVQTAVRIGSSAINKRHADYPGLKVLNTILGGYFGSRLMRNLREDKGLTYGIHSSVSSLDLSGYKLISADVDKSRRTQAVEEIYNEIGKLQRIPADNKEMEVVRNYMSGELLRLFDGPFAMAETFKAVWEFGLDSSYFTRLSETIKTITPDEIMRLAKEYYNIDDLYEVTAG